MLFRVRGHRNACNLYRFGYSLIAVWTTQKHVPCWDLPAGWRAPSWGQRPRRPFMKGRSRHIKNELGAAEQHRMKASKHESQVLRVWFDKTSVLLINDNCSSLVTLSQSRYFPLDFHFSRAWLTAFIIMTI